MARRAVDASSDPAIVVVNPEETVTAEAFLAWLDHRQAGNPTDPGVTAAETLSQLRVAGEA
ncbi:MAG: hypothetical protein ACRDY2_00240 [Acidimicrobiales bacterium]